MLAEAVDSVLSDQLRDLLSFDPLLVTIGMIAAIVFALVVAAAMTAKQLVDAARVPTLRLETTHASPELSLAQGHRWHMFLCAPRRGREPTDNVPHEYPRAPFPANARRSHVWTTGQDQCATIKRQLTLLMPDVSIFLDVDGAFAPCLLFAARVACLRPPP